MNEKKKKFLKGLSNDTKLNPSSVVPLKERDDGESGVISLESSFKITEAIFIGLFIFYSKSIT